jgi:RND family efflux transporter MFP subunit
VLAAGADGAGSRVIATGRVAGWREADVASKIPGRVLRFAFEEGAEIAEGEPVVWLDDGDLRARVHAAEARAREAAVALARVRALHADAIVSASELDRADAAARTSAAALEEARAMLGYATIQAPFPGTLLRKLKESGEAVSISGAPDPVFRIADLSRLEVTAEVPERDLAAVHEGQPAVVTAEPYPDTRFEGVVTRVGHAVGRKRLRSDDPRERLAERVVEVAVALPRDRRLRSGLTVDVTFEHARSRR